MMQDEVSHGVGEEDKKREDQHGRAKRIRGQFLVAEQVSEIQVPGQVRPQVHREQEHGREQTVEQQNDQQKYRRPRLGDRATVPGMDGQAEEEQEAPHVLVGVARIDGSSSDPTSEPGHDSVNPF